MQTLAAGVGCKTFQARAPLGGRERPVEGRGKALSAGTLSFRVMFDSDEAVLPVTEGTLRWEDVQSTKSTKQSWVMMAEGVHLCCAGLAGARFCLQYSLLA